MTQAKTLRTQHAFAAMVEYLLLIAVVAIVVAAFLLTMEQGIVELASRVRHMLAPRL